MNSLFTLGLCYLRAFPTPTFSVTTKARPKHREFHALLFTISVWVLLRPLLTITSKMQETGPTVYSISERKWLFIPIFKRWSVNTLGSFFRSFQRLHFSWNLGSELFFPNAGIPPVWPSWPKQAERYGKGRRTKDVRRDRGPKISDASVENVGKQKSTQMIAIGL